MKKLDHWFVCLDLSQIDEILIRYIDFLAKELKPSTISFLHIIESGSLSEEMANLFPQLGRGYNVEEIIRDDLKKRIDKNFTATDIETRLIIKQGQPTDEIINIIRSMDPDLLVLGEKSGYTGEGVLAKKIVKYVPSSVLFVPETSRHSLASILVPVDYSRHSSESIKAAQTIISGVNKRVIAQHIFKYPTHFFPNIPTEKEDQKITKHLDEKEQKFIKEYGISDDVTFVKSFLKKGKMADQVYNAIITHQADMVYMASKGDKPLMSLLKEDFIEKMVNYNLGIPLFIQKNKKTHQKYLDVMN